MISNPVNKFINGYDTREFTYEGGSILYHFSPYDCGISQHGDCNVTFFADSEEHALNVLERMFQFIIDCHSEYISTQKKCYQYEERNLQKYQSYLDDLKNGKVKVSLAPTNQFYKVGWAENDTI